MTSRQVTIAVLALLFTAPAWRAAGQGSGTVVVNVDPPAAVYVDGRFVGRTNHEVARVEAGARVVRIIHPDYRDVRRVVDIAAGATVVVTLRLADQAVPKTAPAPRVPATVTDMDLVTGINFVNEGDFTRAVDVLEAVTRKLTGAPLQRREQAFAYLYLGVAQLGLEQADNAAHAFRLAREYNSTLSPKSRDFPAELSTAEVLRVWETAKGLAVDQVAAAPTPPPEVKPETPAPPTEPEAPAKTVEALPSEPEWIAHSDVAETFKIVVSAAKPCPGTLSIERDRQAVVWAPNDATCSSGFDVPFAEVRSPVAAPRGGLLLQFRSDREALVLMPAPDADLLDPGVERVTFNQLPVSTQVNIRTAGRRITEAMGRRVDATILGLLVYAPLSELLENPADFDGSQVRTMGRFDFASRDKGPYLLNADAATVRLVPSATTTRLIRSQAQTWRGKDLMVSGTFSRPQVDAASANVRAPFVMTVSKIEPAEGLVPPPGPARSMRLGDVLTNPPASRELIRVVGQYRGANYSGDLPIQSKRGFDDWVIKDGISAVWVIGRPASGAGFSLDTNVVQDRTQWVAVTGVIQEFKDRKGYLYLKAERVELSPPPSDEQPLQDPAPPSGQKLIDPDINFTAPTAELESAARDEQFIIQFTKPMDAESLKTRVRLRYADGPTSEFPHLNVSYHQERAFSIFVDPGESLRPGRTLECVLLPGIKDVDGRLLVPRVLRWKVRAN